MIQTSLKFMQCCNQINTVLKLQTRTCTSTSASKGKWDLFTAVCLERKPVVTQELNELEREYKKLMLDTEFERSLKSDHELQHEADLKYLEALKKGADIDDADVNLKQTAQDRVDAWTEELSKFKPASRTTEADKKNDMKSLKRKLDKYLVFVVNQKIGDKQYFLLPQGKRMEGETLRQTADRVLKESCGTDVKAHIYGNAPTGFYKYKYPKNVAGEHGSTGAKVFIYFARYLDGQLPAKSMEYKWLDRQELKKTLPPQYNTSISQFLMDE